MPDGYGQTQGIIRKFGITHTQFSPKADAGVNGIIGSSEWNHEHTGGVPLISKTTSPTVNDDINDGYTVGTIWINTSTKTIYILVDATASGAIWQRFGLGDELAYAEFTSVVSITATSEATADTVVSAGAVTFDGTTAVMIDFFSVAVNPSPTAGRDLSIFLYDGSSSIGYIGYYKTPASAEDQKPARLSRRLTPSAASHTYSIRASVNAGTGFIAAGTGGAAANLPGFIRITRV